MESHKESEGGLGPCADLNRFKGIFQRDKKKGTVIRASFYWTIFKREKNRLNAMMPFSLFGTVRDVQTSVRNSLSRKGF